MAYNLVTFLVTLSEYYRVAYPYLPPIDPMYDSMMCGLQVPGRWG